jgi:carbonic anhydrase/acetyltransferase-like protein (isoleucine patch superfamily)
MRTAALSAVVASLVILAPVMVPAQQHPEKPPAKAAAAPAKVESHGTVVSSGVQPAASHAPADAHASSAAASSSCSALSPLSGGRPVVPETAGPGFASFVDPSARVEMPERVMIGCRSFVAPFVSLDGSAGPIAIGDETNLQDNVLISGKLVILGDRVTVAHGATIVGPATVGASKGKPAFIGFNAYIDGAMVEGDAFIGHLARIAPGIVIRAGTKVLPGKFIRTQEEADRAELGKVTTVTDGDRAFMAGVLHVNVAFAAGYTDLFHASPNQLRGAGRDPGHSDFNHDTDLPSFAGKVEAHPEQDRFRIVGAVRMDDSFESLLPKVGRNVAIRADEGEHFHFGIVRRVQDRVTFHALEHTDIDVGQGDDFGFHVVVHGGPDDASEPHAMTQVGDDVTIKDWAVVFRSKVGKGCTIGVRAYVDGSHLAAGTVVPDRAIMIKDKIVGYVEW